MFLKERNLIVLFRRHNKIQNLSEYDLNMLANIEQVDFGKNLIDNWPEIDQLLNDETRLKSL